LAAFFSGFAALLTPCVFPMIPMTVSFFTKQSKNRAKGIKNAVFYGISIIVIYVALGSLITAIFGADSLNELSTSVVFNIVFFALLVFFAASFLGAFEIVLPNSWANKIDQQADRGGFVGIFFMALALAIVSFSCTGPIVGTLLVEAASKGGLAPIFGMLGFSSALALPFVLFALFPGMMNSLPKSGGWLNTVKVSLGFLELALAFKFLSNADLVVQAHLLEREVFLAIWIAIFGLWAFYLFGKISLPHDSPMAHISVGRLLMGIFVLTFTIYLVPGLWGAPLKIISGFPPPMKYSESPYGVGNSKGGGSASTGDLPKGAYLGPHDIIAFHEYEDGLAYAKEVNKPILLDFTGHACVNCRKMEDYVWSDPKILNILKEEVVLISLYVDDKTELPKEEQYVSKQTGKSIKTVGNKWSDFQITHYKANAQPYYIILDLEEKQLSESPASYDPDIDLYEQWLRAGIDKF
jgi:thiol:disulfide interchange protein DsbD